MSKLNHFQERDGNINIINVTGAIDSSSAPGFERLIENIVDAGQNIIALNAEEISYVSSAGIGALLYAVKKINSVEGFFAVYGINHEVEMLFKILNIRKHFNVFDEKEEALDFLSGKTGHRKIKNNQSGVISKENESHLQEDNADRVPEKEETPLVYESPLIVECSECGSFVRVHQSGAYICPTCHAGFTAKTDGTVVF